MFNNTLDAIKHFDSEYVMSLIPIKPQRMSTILKTITDVLKSSGYDVLTEYGTGHLYIKESRRVDYDE